MNYGLQISASGVLTSLYRQDVLTNNLANAATPGFKPDVVSTAFRLAVRQEDALGNVPSDALLERLGGGVIMAPNRVALTQGAVQTTGNPLDLALEGDGFFVVHAGEAQGGGSVTLTRDGRFTIDPSRRLVMVSTGLPVLDGAGRPIVVPPGASVAVSSDGVVRQGERTLGRLRIAGVADARLLERRGASLFAAPEGALRAGSARVVQGAIEAAGVDEVSAMMQIASAARAVEANVGMMQYQDRMMDRAINTLGRVA